MKRQEEESVSPLRRERRRLAATYISLTAASVKYQSVIE